MDASTLFLRKYTVFSTKTLVPLQSTPKRERAFERHIAYAGIRQIQKLRFQLQAIQNFDKRRPE